MEISMTPKGSLHLAIVAPGRALCGYEVMPSPQAIPLDDWRHALCTYCAMGREAINREQKSTGASGSLRAAA